jgi:TonB family protein
MPRDRIEVVTQAAALISTALICLFLVAEKAESIMSPPAPPQADVQISLESEIPPAPSVPPPAPPQPQVQPVHLQRAPKPIVQTASPEPAETPPAAESVAVAEPFAAATSPAPPVSHAGAEAAFAAVLRAYVDSRTQPPDSAEYRLLKPSGEVRVRFTLARAGTASEVALAHSSGASSLDRQALAIVAGGHYPAMPDDVYPGEATHVFVVAIEFRAAAGV